jgi:hypothetical protein
LVHVRSVKYAALACLLTVGAATTCFADNERDDTAVDFTRDVVPVLTKAGCNAGACHGSFQGRGGFKLSLLGFDSLADYDAVVKASRGRRVRAASPEQSLLLLKATASTSHGGGKRFGRDSRAYEILERYIRAGLKPPSADDPRIVAIELPDGDVELPLGKSRSLRVMATWSDGSRRDVAPWALYDARDPTALEVTREGSVTAIQPGKSSVSVRYLGQVASVTITTAFGDATPLDFTPRNYIDEMVATQWQRLGVAPAPVSSDAVFLRRVTLDLTGTLPSPDEARKFVASNDADKRSRIVDELLERPEYVDYWALKWGDLLRVHRRYLGDKGLGSFSGWLKRSIRENKPLDQMVSELLTSQGNLFTNGPVGYFFIDQKPEELAETTAQVFLGIRLQCARCHHHPFEAWSQDDYYGLAAFFTRLETRDSGDKGRFGGMQVLRALPKETRSLTVSARPRWFGASEPVADSVSDPRQPLADWLVSASNPYFSRNFANRYWAYLVGRGLVEPIDDQRATNPPIIPALLDALADDFASHHFDPKHLLRTICNSNVYQLAAEIAPARDADGRLFTHRVPRRLPAEVLLDAIGSVTGTREAFTGLPPGTRAIALPDPQVASMFLQTFGRPQRNSPCECARDSSPDLLQALVLMNNTDLNGKIADPRGRLALLLERQASDRDLADELYLAAYGRPVSDHEFKTIIELIGESPVRAEGWQDLLWTLLNSPEFDFNH